MFCSALVPIVWPWCAWNSLLCVLGSLELCGSAVSSVALPVAVPHAALQALITSHLWCGSLSGDLVKGEVNGDSHWQPPPQQGGDVLLCCRHGALSIELLEEEARLGCTYLKWQQIRFIYFCNLEEYKFSCFRLKLAQGQAETAYSRDKSCVKMCLVPAGGDGGLLGPDGGSDLSLSLHYSKLNSSY